MSKLVLVFLVGLAWLITLPVSAYEIATHGALTEKAYERSALISDSRLLEILGIDVSSANAFDEFYYDISGGEVIKRRQNDFEKGYMPNEGKSYLTVKGWLMRGAIREDDSYGEDDPQDDPYLQTTNYHLRRPLHHFYDPYQDKPLNPIQSWLDADVHTAPAWALGTTNMNAFTSPNTPEIARRNHFSVIDAREAMYRALTGRKQDGTTADPDGNGTDPASETVRKAYWATTFRALGDVLHLIQDMAQPQHTRNDRHAGKLPLLEDQDPTGHKSIYEDYINSRAKGETQHFLDGQMQDITPLNYGALAPVQFSNYSDYWSTRQGTVGKGLADYSNRTFFSYGTNLGNNTYTLPSNNTLDYDRVTYSGVLPKYPTVTRKYLVSKTGNNFKMTTEGVFDYGFEDGSLQKRYTLDKVNYDDMANDLIPLAVAYSAGLINYFFRGTLHIGMPEEGVYGIVDQAIESSKATGGFRNIKLKLMNTTQDIVDYKESKAIPQKMTGGNLRLVAKFHRNNCYEAVRISGEYRIPGNPPLESCRSPDEEIVISDPIQNFTLDAGQEKLIWFTFPNATPIPINASDLIFQVVYRGVLGTETDAVVVGTKDVSEPTYFAFYNYDDCYILQDGTTVPSHSTTKENYTMSFSPDEPRIYTASVTDLAPGKYSRLAFVADNGLYTANITGGGDLPLQWWTAQNQVDPYTNDLVPVVDGVEYDTVRKSTDPAGSYVWDYIGYGQFPSYETYLGWTANRQLSSLCFPVDPAPQDMSITFTAGPDAAH